MMIFAAASASKHHEQKSELALRIKEGYENTGSMFLYLDAESYTKFVLKGPKHYHLFVIYSAPSNFCPICKSYSDALEKVADSYHHAGKDDLEKESDPVFFAYLDLSKVQEVSRLHQMTTLPHIYHLHGSDLDVRRITEEFVQLPDREYPISKPSTSPQEILDWVNRETNNKDVKIHYYVSERLSNLIILVLCIAAVTTIGIKLVLICRRNPIVIVALALLVYYISTSGLFYNILQGMNWVGRDEQGRAVFLMGTPRGQFLAEGLTMSALSVLSGMSMFIAARFPYTIRAQKMNPNDLAYFLIGILVFSIACMYIVIGSYVQKAGWYSSHDFAPPPYYRRGPLRVDQGNSF
jgi:hypothetical protein